jgi:germination protein M
VPRRVLQLAILGALVAGCGDAKEAEQTTTTRPAPKRTSSVLVYFLRDGKVAAARRSVSYTGRVEGAAVRAVMAGPNPTESDAGLATGIGSETRLVSLAIVDGSARIALAQPETDEDEPSGAWAVAQIVYTLTQFPSVRGVVFADTRVPGQGLTRADMEDFTPAILVESPVVGETVTAPIRVTGTANTFEANFILRLEARGKKLAERFVTATSGSGQRGTFDATIAAPAGTSGPVTLVAFEPSAEDGRPQNVVRIPLRVQ